MIGVPETLAGACLRPLGHLSGAVPYKAIRLDRKGNFLRSHFVLACRPCGFLRRKTGTKRDFTKGRVHVPYTMFRLWTHRRDGDGGSR